jgi:5-formyltetrahydrofolate cyclo-ligase
MAVPPLPAPDKATLRRRLRDSRIAFAASRPPAIAVPDALRAHFRPGTIVAGYRPIGSEADPADLMAAARAAGCRLALPHVTARAAPMRFLVWDSDEPLYEGPFGLRQPDPDAEPVAPDLILTPLIGFDRHLNRLGQGAGHYDRAFADLPDARRIGVAWSVQRVDPLPTDPWDVPLHAVITELGWQEGPPS